jgi:GntR family transcriptional regulator
MAPISRKSTWPLYLQIAEELREQIVNEELAPGARLPSEHSLMETYDASRQTIRKAIAELKTEGLLDAEQGRGVFVRSRAPILRSANDLLSRERWAEGGGALLGTDVASAELRTEVKVGRIPASVEVAARLGLREGTSVIVRHERRLADDQTIELATTYLPGVLARSARLKSPDDGDIASLYARLEESGHRLERFTEHVASRMPRPAEARALDLGPGTPVVLITRTAWTAEGRPVATTDEVMAADRYELVYEIPAGERARLVSTVEDLQAAMAGVVRGATECLVTTGSRSRDPAYLEVIEQVLRERPRLVHYRVLIGPPHHQVLKDHLLRLLEIRDPSGREYGVQTLCVGMVNDPVREPERFFVASERAAVVTLPSFNTAGAFDSGLVLERSGDAQGLVQHGKALYAASQRLEDVDAIKQLPVLR